MTSSEAPPIITVEIIPALQEQEQILANLLELYAHDFSEYIDLNLGVDGRFGYKRLPLYWKEADRHPFLIMVNGYWVGFVLVCKGSEISADTDVWDMAEFFIVRGYRRLGIGMEVAQEIWKKFPGKWQVRVRARNPPAQEFWSRAVTASVGKPIDPTPFQIEGEDWHVFSFDAKCAGLDK